MAGKKGKSQPRTSPSVRPTAAAKAILKASAWASPVSSACACVCMVAVAALADIGQNRYESYPERSNRVHDGIVGRIDDYVCLRAIAHAAWGIILTVGFDLNGEALGVANEPHRLIDLRQPRVGINRSLRHAPADTLHFGGKNTPGESIEHKLHRITRLDVLQAVLAKVGVDPGVAGIDESQGRLTHGNKFAIGKLQVRDDAIGGGNDRRANKIELCLLDGS